MRFCWMTAKIANYWLSPLQMCFYFVIVFHIDYNLTLKSLERLTRYANVWEEINEPCPSYDYYLLTYCYYSYN